MDTKNERLLKTGGENNGPQSPRVSAYLDAARARLGKIEAWRKQHKIDYAECVAQRDAALLDLERIKINGKKQLAAIHANLRQLQAWRRQYKIDYAECVEDREAALRKLQGSDDNVAQLRLALEECDSIIKEQAELIDDLHTRNSREPDGRVPRRMEPLDESRPALTVLALQRHEKGEQHGLKNRRAAGAGRRSTELESQSSKLNKRFRLIARLFDSS